MATMANDIARDTFTLVVEQGQRLLRRHLQVTVHSVPFANYKMAVTDSFHAINVVLWFTMMIRQYTQSALRVASISVHHAD